MQIILIILLVFLILALRPFFKAYLRFRNMENRFREASRDSQSYGTAHRRQEQASGKRYTDDEGEYADFEDVVGDGNYDETLNEASPSEDFSRTEEQISDAEFEEITD